MTAWLASAGIVLVLTVSAYSGLSSSSEATTGAGSEITPVVTDATSPTPSPTATPAQPTPTPTQVLNRLDCQEIMGTEYLSTDERNWYIANCVRP